VAIRALVVDDSLTVRRRLVELLDGSDDIEVVGEAANGEEAVERCGSLRPDVVTLDLVLPGMTGLEATEQIMARFPTPILIVSSSANRGALLRTYDALAAGAVEAFDKAEDPDGDDDRWERTFVATVRLVSRIRVITHPRGRMARPSPPAEAEAPSWRPPAADRDVAAIAIGASTGGPGALVEVLATLPADVRVPVLFVLHIGMPFGPTFAEWLARQIGRPVDFAVDGERLDRAAGRVVMAPPDQHLLLEGRRLRLSRSPERHSCRPSVDELFESVARDLGPRAVGCLLTGMGRDGATGLLAIRQQGGFTIAQDEATSVVYGMPREAALLGAADRILPLPSIGPALGAAVRRPSKEQHR
jgi:two-component system chemotaxis response regulator CheB